jgi:hypothetical protein
MVEEKLDVLVVNGLMLFATEFRQLRSARPESRHRSQFRYSIGLNTSH